jgi:lipopolysaccharide export system protein LptA
MTVSFRLLALGALALAALAAPAEAQLATSGGPISYSADSLRYNDGEGRLTLEGKVDIVQGPARLRASTVTILFANATPNANLASGDIRFMQADGDVYYVRPAQEARGDRAVYTAERDMIVFSGNVVMAGETSVIHGDVMAISVKEGTGVIRPADGQRVRGVFHPRGQAPAPAVAPAQPN